MTENDIVAIGGKLTEEALLEAYRAGVFPWPDPDFPLMIWACPEHRAILEFSKLKVSKSLEKTRKKSKFTYSINQSFQAVIEHAVADYL